mmetsp:Transcript_16145/g.45952  ORF Transcript_16145/g.45952 Transcript_16145/m.45952 type:complete len:83 (-) Transcript_16145:772-1020(-)
MQSMACTRKAHSWPLSVLSPPLLGHEYQMQIGVAELRLTEFAFNRVTAGGCMCEMLCLHDLLEALEAERLGPSGPVLDYGLV